MSSCDESEFWEVGKIRGMECSDADVVRTVWRCVEVDYCRGVRCLYLGNCVNDYENGTFRCDCQEGFNGTYCEQGTTARHTYRVQRNRTTPLCGV